MLAVIALAAVPKARFAKQAYLMYLGVGVVRFSCLCFCRYGIPAVLLLSVVITVVLLFYPRQSPGDAMMETGQEVGGERERRMGETHVE